MHLREFGVEVEDLFVVEGADFGHRVKVKAGHETRGDEGADAVECFEGALEREG